MNELYKLLSYKVLPLLGHMPCNRTGSVKSNTIHVYYRNNPDGTVRWVWPATLKKPLILRFYNASSFRAKCIQVLIKFLFSFRLQKFFASGTMDFIVSSTNQEMKFPNNSNWAFFAGTTGTDQTALLYYNQYFYKIPVGENAYALFENERKVLGERFKTNFNTCIIPKVEVLTEILKINDVAGNGKRLNYITDFHWNTLYEFSKNKQCTIPLSLLPEWKVIDSSLKELSMQNDDRLPKGLIRKLEALKNSIDENTYIPASLAHGDFTPWNIFVQQDKLALIDWELTKSTAPLLYDAFHFLYQKTSLTEHQTYNQLHVQITSSYKHPVAQQLITENSVDVQLHEQLYLLQAASYYLHQYSKQKVWHPQVSMSIRMWTQAVNYHLAEKQLRTKRQLVLSDVFDFLANYRYAALKWMCGSPEFLSEDSDIDICLDKEETNTLKRFLKQHALVSGLRCNNKSFMKNLTVMLTDHSIISIDCIHSFKRKELVMLDAEDVLTSADKNAFGISVPSTPQDFHYTWLFYTLNGSPIPEKYKSAFHFFSQPIRKELKELFPYIEGLNIKHMSDLFSFNPANRNYILKQLKLKKENKGWNYFINKTEYLIDTVKEQFFRRGFIITFSGVDGAGKSTVIENVRYQMEKKYRRKVVVLRHRPALLPMLNAWKEGRSAAEQRAAERLPRQGNNKNTFSSLIRFSYYYADYLFGQIIIQMKYVLRGYIVLYDRYYFDFINDSKRSNIMLPQWFTSFWYHTLLKPDYNFFLYADAETIVKRKQELDPATIKDLTCRYLKLFKKYEKLYRKSKYITIENDQMTDTLKTIFNHVNKKAA